MHVVGAVLWVGGGLTLTIPALRAERSAVPAEMAMIARPVGLLVLAMGGSC